MLLEIKQMQITGDEIIRFAFDCAREHQVVGWIVRDDVFDVLHRDKLANPFQRRQEFFNALIHRMESFLDVSAM